MSDPAVSAQNAVAERSADDYLSIYLSDHHAGACGGIELAKRSLSNNEDNAVGEFIRTYLLPAIEEDLAALEDVMDRVGVSPQWWKDAAAWAAEKAGRLKLNGQVRGYSPLSQVVELEGLALGVHGKLGMWRVLKELQPTDLRLQNLDFDDLIRRAEEQRAQIEQHRVAAAKSVFV